MAGMPQAVIPTRISGVVLVGAQDASGALWGLDDLNPYRQFQQGKPDAMIASAVLVYRGDYYLPLAAAQSHISQISMLLGQGMTERAVEEAQTAVALVPDNASLKARLGGTLMKVHRDQEARQAFAEALQLAKMHRPNDQSKQIGDLITELQQPEL
jgi:tetratricopeptide (TPR) repeat protein